jgi:methyltransferase NSUN6
MYVSNYCHTTLYPILQILSTAVTNSKDGLLQVARFFPESFHRILLDPPCSALGLRPKFKIPQQTVQELKSLVNYQQGFVREAIHLLQVDGIMTYSTCTMNYHENEGMVCHILKEYPCMELLPIPSNLGGRPGLILRSGGVGGGGLNEIESSYVRRFGSTDDPDDDTIGFFIAKFRKRCSVNPF